MNAFPIQFLGKFHYANGVKGAFLDANSAARAEVLIDDWLLLPLHELDRITPVQHFGAETVTRNAAVVGLTMLFVQRGNA